jgi:hypothetical protein
LEETVDLSSDRLLMMMMMMIVLYNVLTERNTHLYLITQPSSDKFNL